MVILACIFLGAIDFKKMEAISHKEKIWVVG